MKHSNLIGVDVSETSIKVLQLDDDDAVLAYGKTSLEKGVVENGLITDVKAFSLALNRVLSETSPNVLNNNEEKLRAVLCLPESKLFSHYYVIPNEVKDSDFANFIHEDARKIIPLEFDSLYWNYHVVEEGSERKATFVGVTKSDLENYITAFTEAGLKPSFIGGELFALGKALLPNAPFADDYMIIDIGAHSSTIGLFSVDAVPNMSIVVRQGGQYLTQSISEKLQTSPEESERLKRQYGVSQEHEDTKVPAILREALSQIIDKAIEARKYFETQTKSPIKHVIIAGGSSLLPHIKDFFSSRVGVEVLIADPLQKIKDEGHVTGDVPSALYSNVIGLALCAKQEDISHLNLLTQYRLDENIEKTSMSDIHSLRDIKQYLFGYGSKVRDIFISKLKSVRATYKINFDYRLISTIVFFGASIVFLVWAILTYA